MDQCAGVSQTWEASKEGQDGEARVCVYINCVSPCWALVALASLPGTAAVLSSAPCSAEASGDS